MTTEHRYLACIREKGQDAPRFTSLLVTRPSPKQVWDWALEQGYTLLWLIYAPVRKEPLHEPHPHH